VWEHKPEAHLAIYKVQEPKPEARLAIYRVWERKLELVYLFAKCGSKIRSSFGYLQSVRAKSDARFAIYKVWERKCNCILHPDLNCNPDQHGSGGFYLYLTGLIQNATIKFIT
jgi:hypothetical protein